ncbi:glycosyltransferase [Stella sp.]|uniref:glycosyltransferase n=1 Tax=Stella sp. TaxID=2912054 RepID=UPI0035B3F42C
MPSDPVHRYRILVVCPGSLGDLDPFLAIVRHLIAGGHQVTVATLYRNAALVEAAGARFAPVHAPELAQAEEKLHAQIFLTPDRAMELFRREILDRIPETVAMMRPLVAGHDLCVTQTMAYPAQIAAEAAGGPWLSAVLSPFDLPSRRVPAYAPPTPALRDLAPGQRMAFLHAFMQPYHQARARSGLPPGPLPHATFSRQGVLALFSRHFVPDPGDWPKAVTTIGFCRHVAEPDPADWARAMAFVEAGPPPVVLTQGSHSAILAGRFFQTAIAAARRLGQRVMTIGLPAAAVGAAEGPDLACFARLPFGRIFPYVRAVVSHPGMGTMARALEAGRPILAVPSAVSDQPDNAVRAHRLGAAIVLPLPAFSEERATAALARLLGDARYGEAARRVAQALAEEGDGAPRAAAAMLEACRRARSPAARAGA